jgi:hypothetical protein
MSAPECALNRIGVPKDQVLKYETALEVDKHVERAFAVEAAFAAPTDSHHTCRYL